MDKAADAFRTISEVAETIGIPAHVLRFWESRFPQIKPIKRAGGRRYYRPTDVALVSGIRQLLHVDGLTIREVQSLLRAQGVRHVATIGGAQAAELDGAEALALAPVVAPLDELQVVTLTPKARRPASKAVGTQAGTVQSLFPQEQPPPPLREIGPGPAPSGPRKARIAAKRRTPDQPGLPLLLDRAPDDAPEAPHIWVEAEPAEILSLPPRPARPAQRPDALAPPSQALAQVAAQLQPLPVSAVAQSRPALRDLHRRLRLLHARMAQPPRPER